MGILHEGTELASVWFQDGDAISVHQTTIASIKIVDVNGQMAPTPWAKITRTDGSSFYTNVALMEGFEILGEERVVKTTQTD